ncbi:hypothetical protein [Acidiphilium sp.]|uniref:hypothetical protein n=1 Tax=Acidiphilium sp. TaxID=527 RepID=UPI003D040B8C
MLRTLFDLFDGLTLRHLTRRIVFALVALAAALVGFGFLLAAGFLAVAHALGGVVAALIFGASFVFLALGLYGIGRYQWTHRPRPLLARARYSVAAEALRLAQVLILKEPAKAIIAALILGAVTEFTRKPSARPPTRSRDDPG